MAPTDGGSDQMDVDLARAFNEQINLEFESMYVYLQMAAHFESRDLPGFARWMRLQAEEEQAHAMRFFDFLLDRGAEIALQEIAAPQVETSSTQAVFEQALDHERAVTAAIHDLYRHATDVSDFASYPILQWFVDEQVEEEATVGQIVRRLAMAGDDASALLLLDGELGARGPG
jgi:ferritin